MVNKKMFKMTAAVVSAALLANTCISGLFGASAEVTADEPITLPSQVAYIDNSNLLPAYLTNDKVTLEAIDGSDTAVTPDWVKSLIVTELNVERASTNGQFSGMEKALKLLAEEGVNGVWLTPINNDTLIGEDGTQTGTAGNRYSNFGPDTVSCTLTGKTDYNEGWAEVKKFVDLAHSYNIRVLLDIVTWGVNEQAPVYTEGNHANWFTEYKSAWNGYLFDWSNAKSTGLYDWFKDGMIGMITATGADGFRADCGSSYAGSAFFSDVRKTLTTDGYKISMISEHRETRDGTFDFEEHSYIDSSYDMYKTHTFYTANNIVDAVKNGTFTGTGKYYNALVSCHDYSNYTTANDLITMGYASIATPYIPLWYFGEEWNNTKTDGTVQLYQNLINYDQIDQNRDYYETIKSYIRVRRTYSDIFENFTDNSTNANICKVSTSGSSLYQAYARYSADRAVLVVPNNSVADAHLTV
ncbi:MAG: hypothetical protein PHR14_08385, partial [Oscillospiraceae bacterium]|nr:hypothetical protein [Oscillospiraceae bacterium]